MTFSGCSAIKMPNPMPVSYTHLDVYKRQTVDYVAGRNRYMGYLISLGIYSFKGVKVGLDCEMCIRDSAYPVRGVHRKQLHRPGDQRDVYKRQLSDIPACTVGAVQTNLDTLERVDTEADQVAHIAVALSLIHILAVQ